MKKVSFVIPCYCSEHSIEEVVREIEDTIRPSEDYDYEILLVNDASPDQTWECIEKIVKRNPRVFGINLAKNFGQHAALMAGFRQVSGEIVICLDDDGQTPACEMYKLLDKIEEGADVVYAEYKNKQHSSFRNFGSKVNGKMTEWMLGKPRELYLSSYFASRRFVIDEIAKYENAYPYVLGLVLRTTKRIENVEVEHRERKQGVSGYSFTKLISLWLNGFTAFSIKPLRIVTVFGIVVAFVGLGCTIWTIINKCVNPGVPLGWSSTMSALLLLGGAILFVLGMIGEYVGRIYICLNNAPQYVIRDMIGTGHKENWRDAADTEKEHGND